MPWNAVSKYPGVIRYLNEHNRFISVSLYTLEDAIINVLGVTSQKTIDRHKEMLVRLGYLRVEGKVFGICQNGTQFNFKGPNEAPVDELLDKVGS